MKIDFKFYAMILVVFLVGCSSEPVKATGKSTEMPAASVEPASQIQRAAASEDIARSLNFPLTQNKRKLSSLQFSATYGLNRSLILYCETFGQMPDTLVEYIHSGFPLLWGRDLNTGQPVHVIDDNLAPDESSFGTIKYTKTGMKTASIDYIAYDVDNSRSSNEDKWMVNTQDVTIELEKRYSFVDTDEVIHVGGGMEYVPSIEDPSMRKLYTQFGQFSGFLSEQTSRYHNYNKAFPKSFTDLYNAQQFFIKENLMQFQESIRNFNDVEFKWGFDPDRNEDYTWLKVDGVLLISECVEYRPEERVPFPHDCNPDETNMSSPLLTTEDLLELQIPVDYSISVNELVNH